MNEDILLGVVEEERDFERASLHCSKEHCSSWSNKFLFIIFVRASCSENCM